MAPNTLGATIAPGVATRQRANGAAAQHAGVVSERGRLWLRAYDRARLRGLGDGLAQRAAYLAADLVADELEEAAHAE
jgi:hypothetical protein